MKYLIIGLGSMGKRRIRNLIHLNERDILGFDIQEKRRQEVDKLYNTQTIANVEDTPWKNVDALIISTPPHIHDAYIKLAIEKKKPCFVEASVILKNLPELNRKAKKANVLIAPSCTLRFHPAIKDIAALVKSGLYGQVTNFTYHSGQYLPDWHPWEKVKDYYAGQKETGGAREIVPFELTWITDIFGFPKKIFGAYGKTTDIGAPIDDTYAFVMDFGRSFGTVTVDIVARYAIRHLILNMERGQIIWRWDEPVVSLYEAGKKRWVRYHYPQGQVATGYNVNISEDMYIEEIKAFIDALHTNSRKPFPNSIENDIKILTLLETIEHSYDQR